MRRSLSSLDHRWASPFSDTTMIPLSTYSSAALFVLSLFYFWIVKLLLAHFKHQCTLTTRFATSVIAEVSCALTLKCAVAFLRFIYSISASVLPNQTPHTFAFSLFFCHLPHFCHSVIFH